MKRLILSAVILILSVAHGFDACGADRVKVISANLRTAKASGKDGDNKWDNRKDGMVRMLREEDPDIFGVQEGLLAQIDYLSEKCPAYSRVGVGRDDGKKAGEFCSIFYRDSLFTLLDSGNFWLSDTPDVPSKGWGEQYFRIVTWARLKEKSSGKEMCIFNTHFPLNEEAKARAIEVLVGKIDSICPTGPVILTADWNMKIDAPALESLQEHFFDLRTSFRKPDKKNTYNAFGNKGGELIDHIFFRGLKPLAYRNLNGDYGVPFISDHYPIEGVFGPVCEEESLKVLAIGNSYSVDAVNQNLHELAEEAATNLVIGNLYIGGCSLERHWTSLSEHKADYTYHKIGPEGVIRSIKGVEMTRGLDDEEWDIIVMQQTSRTSGLVEGYEPYLGNLVDYLRREKPGARLMWHQTWAYMKNSTHASFPNYDSDQARMYKGIMDRSSEICSRYGLDVIPSGTAIQNLRSSYIGQNVNRDGHHLSLLTGRYTAALTWYATILGKNPCEVSYAPHGILPFQSDAAREAARLAAQNPFKCTSMKDFQPAADPLRETPVDYSNLEQAIREVYGTCPDKAHSKIRYEVLREKKGLLDGNANAKEIAIYFCNSDKSHVKGGWNCFRVLLLEPAFARKKAPVMLGMNMRGNHSITSEKWVHKPDKKELDAYKVYDNQPKGCDEDIWKVSKLIDKGYALLTYCYADICPDFNECASRGVQRCYPDKYSWGAIAAWAWSLSRAMDFIESCPELDMGKVYLFGEGKLAKAGLWAARNDGRLNPDAPKGLPSFYKLNPGTPESLGPYESHPHWFCDNFYFHSAFPQP